MNTSARTTSLVGVAIALILLVLFGDLPSSARWALVLSDAAHGPVSAVIAIILMILMQQRAWPSTLARRWIASIAATTLIGILIELVQSVIGRDGELADVINDLLGSAAGTGWYVLAIQRRATMQAPRSLLATAGAVALLATVMLSVPILTMAGAYAAKNSRGRVLTDANTPFGTYFLTTYWLHTRTAPLPQRWQSPGQRNGFLVPLNTLTGPGNGWGLSVDEVDPHWRHRQALAIDIANPTPKPLRLRLRVFDRDDGLGNALGFITTLQIPASTRTVSRVTTRDIAAGRNTQAIDLDHVRGIVIDSPTAAEARNGAREFYLIRIELE